MADRDGFSKRTVSDVALRASHRCSLPDCQRHTAGPGDESSSAVAIIGEAAHICAASPGGKRYVESMSQDERSHINNAIWLCVTHARLIDRDAVTFSIERLREIKLNHEAACKAELQRASSGIVKLKDLIAIGPGVVATGEVLEVAATEWTVSIANFVDGDFNALIGFIDRFHDLPEQDRYILVNEVGDGRSLSRPPVASKGETGLVVRCPVAPAAHRIAAQDLGGQMAIHPETEDIYYNKKKGQIARVSGLESLPQNVQQCLSLQRGEWFFSPDYGVRFAEYLQSFMDSPWLGHLLMLDVIRQASIPYHHRSLNQTRTPLQCIERVVSVEALVDRPVAGRLPIRCVFDVKGVGRWECRVRVYVPKDLIS
jgi:phage baseplate assembly protein W